MNGKKALREVARRQGISEQEVRREIEIAIAEGMKSKDPAVQAYWKAMPSKGEVPTPEEVIEYATKKINAETSPPKPSKILYFPQ